MHDNDAVGSNNEDKQEDTLKLDRGGSILSAIKKVGAIISISDNLLISFCSFERLFTPYNQATYIDPQCKDMMVIHTSNDV